MKMRTWVILALALVFVMTLSLTKDLLIKISVQKGIDIITGLKVDMKSFRVGLIRTVVDIGSLTVRNPAGFEEPFMLEAPRIYVDYDLGAMMRKDIHIRKLHIDVKNFVVVKSAAGKLNVDSLKIVQDGKAAPRRAEKKDVSPVKVRIDELRLKIGKAVYKDYTAGAKPSVTEFEINIDEEYKNVTNPQAVVGLIVVRALSKTTISRLADFDMGSLDDKVSLVLKTADIVSSKASAAAQSAVSKATQAVGGGHKAVEDAAKSLGGIFSDLAKGSEGN